MASTYIWLPLTISGTTASMPTNYVNWVVNVSTGAMGGGPTETTYEGESAALSGGAVAVTCSGCSGGKAARDLGGSAGGVASFSGISSTVSTKTTIRIKYEVCIHPMPLLKPDLSISEPVYSRTEIPPHVSAPSA